MYQQITEAFLTLACLCHSKGRLFFPVLRAPLADVVSDFHERGSSTKKRLDKDKRKWAYIVTHVTLQVFLRAVRAPMTSEVFLQSSWCARSHPCPAMLTLKRTRPRVNWAKVWLSNINWHWYWQYLHQYCHDTTGTGTVGTCTSTNGIHNCTDTGTDSTDTNTDGIYIWADSTDTGTYNTGISTDTIHTCIASAGTSTDGTDFTPPNEGTVNDADGPSTSTDSTGGQN